jgi:hypothetical protein
LNGKSITVYLTPKNSGEDIVIQIGKTPQAVKKITFGIPEGFNFTEHHES